jgi:Permease for cytosine/purines, uracil, thiamine, allantoin
VFLPVLVDLSSSHLVPYPQNVRFFCHAFSWMLLSRVSPSRHLFTLKAMVAPTAGITFFIWCIVKAHGVGPIIHQPSKIHGPELGWAMVSSLMSCISNMATLVTYVLPFLTFTPISYCDAATPPISHPAPNVPRRHYGPNSSQCRLHSRLSVLLVSLLARRRKLFTERPFGRLLTCLGSSWMGIRRMRLDLG